jgi:hypothetical protein
LPLKRNYSCDFSAGLLIVTPAPGVKYGSQYSHGQDSD